MASDNRNDDDSRPVPISSTSSLDSFANYHSGESTATRDGNEKTSNNKGNEAQADAKQTSLYTTTSSRPTSTATSVQTAPASQSYFPSIVDSSVRGMISGNLASVVFPTNPVPMMADTAIAAGAANNSIPEFLYQLTKMLTDDNRDVIEWTNGMIEVHNPHKLESEVLHKYFRHSKFASFQRQLNYFGFRKLAGKGKMAPCSYVNEAASGDISNLLYIKRKSGAAQSSKDKGNSKGKRRGELTPDTSKQTVSSASAVDATNVNPVLVGILQRTQSSITTANTGALPAAAVTAAPSVMPTRETPNASKSSESFKLARTAVGKGIKHNFALNPETRPSGLIPPPAPRPASTMAVNHHQQQFQSPTRTGPGSSVKLPPQAPIPKHGSANDAQRSLSILESNYRNSLSAASQETKTVRSTKQTQQQQQPSTTTSVATNSDPANQVAAGASSAFSSHPSTLDATSAAAMGFVGEDPLDNSDLADFLDPALVDLAMIPFVDDQPSLDDGTQQQQSGDTTKPSGGFSFIDFPYPDMRPTSS